MVGSDVRQGLTESPSLKSRPHSGTESFKEQKKQCLCEKCIPQDADPSSDPEMHTVNSRSPADTPDQNQNASEPNSFDNLDVIVQKTPGRRSVPFVKHVGNLFFNLLKKHLITKS